MASGVGCSSLIFLFGFLLRDAYPFSRCSFFVIFRWYRRMGAYGNGHANRCIDLPLWVVPLLPLLFVAVAAVFVRDGLDWSFLFFSGLFPSSPLYFLLRFSFFFHVIVIAESSVPVSRHLDGAGHGLFARRDRWCPSRHCRIPLFFFYLPHVFISRRKNTFMYPFTVEGGWEEGNVETRSSGRV
jgi:hypothetical protein